MGPLVSYTNFRWRAAPAARALGPSRTEVCPTIVTVHHRPLQLHKGAASAARQPC